MNPHEDLPATVLGGLGWYYMLAALMNAGAAAYVAYGEMVSEGASRLGLAPRTRRMPGWLGPVFLGLYGLAALIIVFRSALPGGVTAAYMLCATANGLLAIWAGADAAHFAEAHEHGHGEGDPLGPPSLDEHQPAVGLGAPINRTLWALIWGVCAMIFQMIGVVYMLGHQVYMPQIFRDGIDAIAGPTTFFVGATIAFIAAVRYRRVVANGLVAWTIVNLFLLYFGLSMTDYDFRDIVTKPDNVPIVGLLILVGCFFWLGLRRAVINDSRIAQGLPPLEGSSPRRRSPGPTWSTPS